MSDFVITPAGPAQVKKISKSEYGYKTFHVKYLLPSSLSISIDQYIPQNIQLLAPMKQVKTKVLEILKEASSAIKINHKKINQAIKSQVLHLSDLIQSI